MFYLALSVINIKRLMDEITVSISRDTADLMHQIASELGISFDELVSEAFEKGLQEIYDTQRND